MIVSNLCNYYVQEVLKPIEVIKTCVNRFFPEGREPRRHCLTKRGTRSFGSLANLIILPLLHFLGEIISLKRIVNDVIKATRFRDGIECGVDKVPFVPFKRNRFSQLPEFLEPGDN